LKNPDKHGIHQQKIDDEKGNEQQIFGAARQPYLLSTP
jgi:hypothetical protein